MNRDEVRVLLLDHRDSFVHLLADQLARCGARVDVAHAGLSLPQWQQCLADERPDLVVLSPGPGHPRDAALANAWLATAPDLPVFGVCLGHQILGRAAGAEVVRGREPAHGEACEVRWHGGPLAAALPERMPVARYHSLVVEPPTASEAGAVSELRVVASARRRGETIVMAIEHTRLPRLGVQFHPESVLTPHGPTLLRAVLDWAVLRTRSRRGDATR